MRLWGVSDTHLSCIYSPMALLLKERKMEILDGEFSVSVDSNQNVFITGKDKGSIESQSVEVILLMEIAQLLRKILDNQEQNMAI